MRRFKKSILEHEENMRVSLVQQEMMEEYDEDLVENMIINESELMEPEMVCVREQEGGE